ncbi:MAG: hypothetical protein EOP06_11635, partial [Proteobacteria bacterium]
MPNLKELLERENQAGNQEDGQFNGAPIKIDSDKEEFNEILDRNLDHNSPLRTDAWDDTVAKNYNSDLDPNENIESARGQETQEPSRLNFTGQGNGDISGPKLGGIMKKITQAGPAGAVIGAIGTGAMVVFLLFASPATLFSMIKASLTNEFDSLTPVLNVRTVNKIGAKVDGLKGDKVDYCKKPSSRLCKGATMSEKMRTAFEKAGIKVDVDPDIKPNGRNVVRSISIPDNLNNFTKINSTKELTGALKNNPILRTALYQGFNPKTAAFLDNKFGKMLSDRFLTSKDSVIRGDNDADLRRSFRESAGVTGESGPDGRLTDRQSATRERYESIRGKIGGKLKGGTPAQVTCGLYDAARAMSAAAKTVQMIQLVQFSMVFLREFDRTIAGDGDANVAEFIGDRWNYTENSPLDEHGDPNRFYQTTASDAEGMKMVLHGDIINLTLWAQRYIVGGGMFGYVNEAVFLTQIAAGGGNRSTGKTAIATACKVGCFSGANPVQVLINAGVCAIMSNDKVQALVGAAAAPVVGPLMDEVFKLADNMHLDDDTKGVDLGNAVAAGAGIMLGKM